MHPTCAALPPYSFSAAAVPAFFFFSSFFFFSFFFFSSSAAFARWLLMHPTCAALPPYSFAAAAVPAFYLCRYFYYLHFSFGLACLYHLFYPYCLYFAAVAFVALEVFLTYKLNCSGYLHL